MRWGHVDTSQARQGPHNHRAATVDPDAPRRSIPHRTCHRSERASTSSASFVGDFSQLSSLLRFPRSPICLHPLRYFRLLSRRHSRALPATTAASNLRGTCRSASQVRKRLVDVIQFFGEFRDTGFRTTAGISFQIDAGQCVSLRSGLMALANSLALRVMVKAVKAVYILFLSEMKNRPT
jgi:hypothetical protein